MSAMSTRFWKNCWREKRSVSVSRTPLHPPPPWFRRSYLLSVLHLVFKHGFKHRRPRCQTHTDGFTLARVSSYYEGRADVILRAGRRATTLLPDPKEQTLSEPTLRLHDPLNLEQSSLLQLCQRSRMRQRPRPFSVMGGPCAVLPPARMALWALNSCPRTHRLQSVKRDCSHRLPRSSDS